MKKRRNAPGSTSPKPTASQRRSNTTQATPLILSDFIITDECHRSIYNLWRQVLEYFDAFLIGLTATPSAQTFGFFQQNLVMEYTHEQAVADGVNVDSDIYRIRTQITEEGSTIEAGQYVDRMDRTTRKVRWEQLDEDLTYTANQLDRGGRGGGPDSDGHPYVPGPIVHRDIPGALRSPQDHHLREGRQSRGQHRENSPARVRQGRRLLPEDHVPHHRRGPGDPDRDVPQQL